ncbi:MAG: hypothetical protein M3162_03575 [Thermoproteota archaeon]|nr:hypothetical protein [Thermoproteota archaeon]
MDSVIFADRFTSIRILPGKKEDDKPEEDKGFLMVILLHITKTVKQTVNMPYPSIFNNKDIIELDPVIENLIHVFNNGYIEVYCHHYHTITLSPHYPHHYKTNQPTDR